MQVQTLENKVLQCEKVKSERGETSETATAERGNKKNLEAEMDLE